MTCHWVHVWRAHLSEDNRLTSAYQAAHVRIEWNATTATAFTIVWHLQVEWADHAKVHARRPRPWRRPDVGDLPSQPAERTWACDFIQTCDLLFRQVYAFFTSTCHRDASPRGRDPEPTQAWTAAQLRNALMSEDAPVVLLRDRADRFGASCDRVAEGAGARVIKIAVRAPNMNAIAERFRRQLAG